MSTSLSDQVRRSCQEVAEQAAFVEIDQAALAQYIAELPSDRLLLPEMDPAIHYLGHGRQTLAYYLTLDAINFGSGYFPEVLGDPRRSGYRTVAAALTEQFACSGPITPDHLRRLTPEECARVVALDRSSPAGQELIALYTKALNDLGAFVCASFGGDFAAVVEEAGQSAERLVEILTAMPLYNDTAPYNGREIPFYKRGQLTAADLHIAFAGQEAGIFYDIDQLTICADNLVPHVLRLDGVLKYQDELASQIDQGEPLPAGSQEEVEIRACAVHAGELMVAQLLRRGEKVNAMMLDNFLWHRGQEPAYRARPRHRTRTVFY